MRRKLAWLTLLLALGQVVLRLQSALPDLSAKAAPRLPTNGADPTRLLFPTKVAISSRQQVQELPKPRLQVQLPVHHGPALLNLLVLHTPRKSLLQIIASRFLPTALVQGNVLVVRAARSRVAIVEVSLLVLVEMARPAPTLQSLIARTVLLLLLLLLWLGRKVMVLVIGLLTARLRRILRRARTRHCIASVRKFLSEIWLAATTTTASISGSIGLVWGSRTSQRENGCVQSVGSCQRESWQ